MGTYHTYDDSDHVSKEKPSSIDQEEEDEDEGEVVNVVIEETSSINTKSNYVRRIIDFPRNTFDVLEELAKGRSIGDAIRDAIALSKWFKDIREDGARILVERNGKLREVITIKYPPDK